MLRNAVLVACCTAAVLGSIRSDAAEKIPAYISAAVADPEMPPEEQSIRSTCPVAASLRAGASG